MPTFEVHIIESEYINCCLMKMHYVTFSLHGYEFVAMQTKTNKKQGDARVLFLQ